ncbi:MAG: carboxylating nicotinate-nucleotide diphosphorylase [Ignavibacteriales bacterium]|nr:carboxylating nicotinate-nucleotide diphosphorylase [Ignavibacteriales bacterium]
MMFIMKELYKKNFEKVISTALKEDIGKGDVTTELLIPKKKKAAAYFIAKQDGIIAGLDIAKLVFKKLDEKIKWESFVEDGSKVKAGTKIAEVKGSVRALLSGERTALNFLQRMSGIATLTSVYVEKISGTNTKILDTRKTVPGLRLFDKFAVECGGGTNHRIGLFDMVMIKDNHIKAAGSITKAVDKIRKSIPKQMKIEVETTNISEVDEAMKLNVDVIMLDNMNLNEMKEAVRLINKKCFIEASGGINLETVRAIAETGVDFISVGALTHSVKALDISMKITNDKSQGNSNHQKSIIKFF